MACDRGQLSKRTQARSASSRSRAAFSAASPTRGACDPAPIDSVGEPAINAERVAFWGNLHRRLDALSNRIGEDDRAKIIDSIHTRIPMVTVDEIRALQRENSESDEKFWAGFQNMNADFAAGQKIVAGIASRKAAEAEGLKERLDRLAKGEDVKGGLGKPMTGEECNRILKREGLTDDDIRFMRAYRSACTPLEPRRSRAAR
jgi:hypothetical protein